MNNLELHSTEKPDNDNKWDILTTDDSEKEFFSEEASKKRMDQYLESINADDFMAVIRGYRKHLDDFQKKFSTEHFKEKYDNNPDLLSVYAFSNLVKDYLSNKLKIKGVDLEIKRKDYNNAKGGHIDLTEGKIYINFDYHERGTLGDVAKVIAHEMWHAKQALLSFEYNEDDITVAKTPYFDALFENYQGASSDGYYDQPVEREARAFADAFEQKIFSDNSSYEAWMHEKYGLPSEYYGQLATDKYFRDWYDDGYDWYDEDDKEYEDENGDPYDQFDE